MSSRAFASFSLLLLVSLLWSAAIPKAAAARTIDLEVDAGALAENFTLAVAWHNGGILNKTLNALAPGDTLVVPNKTFHVMGGILVTQRLVGCTIQLEGTLDFSDDIDSWPRKGNGGKAPVLECLNFEAGVDNVTFTSSGVGMLRGNGAKWWGFPGIGYLQRQENRPRLFKAQASSTNVLLENWHFVQSPYWTVTIEAHGLEIRNCNIDNRRSASANTHSAVELTAFNTDGFDVTGQNIWIHHCNVWCQDDTFCIKDGTQDVVVEDVNASGVGLTIGSIASHVRNITFRRARMHNTLKGIYMKFRGAGVIEDILYEDIIIEEPEQWAIWIGPAQQSDSNNLCAAHPCSICWPTLPGSKCDAPQNATFRNVTLRNIKINRPKQAPGVILANSNSPMENLVFEDVVVSDPAFLRNQYHTCEGVASGVAKGATKPVPQCFEDRTGGS